jgi:hypothetical protein
MYYVQVIQGLDISEIDIWEIDSQAQHQLPTNWLPHLRDFLACR